MTPPGEGGVADENHSWMCGARARFLNRDDSSPGEGLHQRRLDWRHSRALCRPSRLIGSWRRLPDRPPRSEPPETIKAAAAELATGHGSLSVKHRLTHKRARLAYPSNAALMKQGINSRQKAEQGICSVLQGIACHAREFVLKRRVMRDQLLTVLA